MSIKFDVIPSVAGKLDARMNMEETRPFFSVVVPMFNAAATIASCLETLRIQADRDAERIEIIVVDDASTDIGPELAETRCDQLVRLTENGGAARARNAGATKARGDIIVFVDADVVVRACLFTSLRRFFEGRPEIAAAVGRYARRTILAKNFLSRYHNSFTRYHHDLVDGDIDWFWGALGAVRRDAFMKTEGFDERYHGASAEDLMFGQTLIRAGYRIWYLPEVEARHARHFSLRCMIANDYKKAVLGTKLKIRGLLPKNAPAFASSANIGTAVLLPFFLSALLCGVVRPLFLAHMLVLGMFLLVINRSFYRFLGEEFRSLQLAGAITLHWLQIVIITCAVIGGVMGTLLGRSPYGRPGWF